MTDRRLPLIFRTLERLHGSPCSDGDGMDCESCAAWAEYHDVVMLVKALEEVTQGGRVNDDGMTGGAEWQKMTSALEKLAGRDRT